MPAVFKSLNHAEPVSASPVEGEGSTFPCSLFVFQFGLLFALCRSVCCVLGIRAVNKQQSLPSKRTHIAPQS